jgi:rhomboid protease GluP
VLYVLGAFGGNVMSFLFTDAVSVGASTAVFGLIGAEGVFLYQNRKLFAHQFRSAIGNVIFIVAVNLFIGLSPSIDNWGHIGGLIGGLMFTSFAGPLWDVESNFVGGYNLVDKRPVGSVVTGVLVVAVIFGALAVWGFVR